MIDEFEKMYHIPISEFIERIPTLKDHELDYIIFTDYDKKVFNYVNKVHLSIFSYGMEIESYHCNWSELDDVVQNYITTHSAQSFSIGLHGCGRSSNLK